MTPLTPEEQPIFNALQQQLQQHCAHEWEYDFTSNELCCPKCELRTHAPCVEAGIKLPIHPGAYHKLTAHQAAYDRDQQLRAAASWN
jgi:hypothetical protein